MGPKESNQTKSKLVASSGVMLFNKGMTKALIRLRGCTDWSGLLLLANPKDRLNFSSRDPNYSDRKNICSKTY